MTPLAHVTKTFEFFKHGGTLYKFNVPDDRATRSYIASIRKHIKRKGYRWSVNHIDGQAWLIAKKVIK